MSSGDWADEMIVMIMTKLKEKNPMTKENLKGIIKKILKRKAKKLPGFQKYLN